MGEHTFDKRRNTLKDMVGRDVRGRTTQDEADFLRSPSMLDDFERELKSMKREVEWQFMRRKRFVAQAQRRHNDGHIDRAELDEEKARSREWRESAGKVLLVGVEGKLDEVKSLRRYYSAHLQPAAR